MNLPGKNSLKKGLCRTHQSVKNAVTGFFKHPETIPCEHLPQEYSYIFRKKSLWELTRISSIVCGIEFCYAAETAFVTPVLRSLGLNVKFVSMVWFMGPFLTFILTPVLGSFSDSCQSRFGRRRPFILLLTVGIVIGLTLIPYGGRIGLILGDRDDTITPTETVENYIYNPSTKAMNFELFDIFENSSHFQIANTSSSDLLNKNSKTNTMIQQNIVLDFYSILKEHFEGNVSKSINPVSNAHTSRYFSALKYDNISSHLKSKHFESSNIHIIGIILTVLGTIFLDFCADSLQAPCRAYLMDVSLPEEHSAGLAVFSLNCGIGSAVGYGLAAIRWNITLWGNVLEGQVIISFTILSAFYLLFVSTSLYSFPEVPLPLLNDPLMFKEYQEKRYKGVTQSDMETSILVAQKQREYSSTQQDILNHFENDSYEENIQNINGIPIIKQNSAKEIIIENDSAIEIVRTCEQRSLKDYLKSILFMPKSLRILALTCLLYALAIVSYTLFFTDFVGECVYKGNPHAPKNSQSYARYKEGVRFGCLGMAFSSLACAVYSGFIENIAARFGAKLVFIAGGLTYATGMIIMAVVRHPAAVIILSACPGVMYTTAATIPFVLLSNYHTSETMQEGSYTDYNNTRGMGTDVGIFVSIMVVSQCIMSLCMGNVVDAVGSTVVTVCSAALFSICGAIAATQVKYFNAHDIK